MKKVLALVLVAMMVIGMAPMALASTIIDPKDNPAYGESEGIVLDLFDGGSFLNMGETTIDLGSAADPTNTEFAYPLGTLTFFDKAPASSAMYNYTVDGKYAYRYDGYTRQGIKDDKIGVELRVTNGQKVVDKVEIKYLSDFVLGNTKFTFEKAAQPAYVQVTFKDEYVSTGDTDYKFMVYLTKDKKRDKSTEVIFEGNYKNQETEVGDGDIYVYLGDDVPVVKSTAYIKNIDIELDGDLTVHTKFFNDKKYYAKGSSVVTSDDDEILTKYPSIDAVYSIKSVGLNNSYTTVSIDISDKLFVYNSNLEYIGTTSDKLPYSTKYYVSTTELDVEGADVEEPGEEPGEGGDDFEEDPGMGGDDVPENVNDNPGTGR